MMLLAIKIAPSSLAAVLEAIQTLVPSNQIELYESVPPPKGPADDGLEELAKRAVAVLRPKPTQPMRREALQKLAQGHDTFFHQGGEPDAALRNAMAAISKALRGVFGTIKRSVGLPFPGRPSWPTRVTRALSIR